MLKFDNFNDKLFVRIIVSTEVTRLKFTKMKTVLCAVSAVFLASIFGAFPSEAKTAFDPSYYFEKYVDVANELRKNEPLS